MDEQSTRTTETSRIEWSGLESWARGKVQEFIQGILEEEVTEFLGRKRHERRSDVDEEGYRNGYGKPRKLTMSCGTITLRRPRVRDLAERFESAVLPMFIKRTEAIRDLLPLLYLHGLAEGDFEMALRGLLGDDANLSASTVARLKERWKAEQERWSSRSLKDLEVAYVWVDGVYVKAGLEKERSCLLVVIAALRDGSKVILSLTAGHRESTPSWSAVLRDLRDRGLEEIPLIVGDGHLGIWGAIRNVYPEAEEQRCWNHRIINVLDQVPKKHQPTAREMLKPIPYSDTRAKAEKMKEEFQRWCHNHDFDKAAQLIDEDWERMVTFHRFPEAHWKHLRTTNVVESPFAALRLRTNAAKRFKKVANATAVIWKMLTIAESRFRRIAAPELLPQVCDGTRFQVRLRKPSDQEAAA